MSRRKQKAYSATMIGRIWRALLRARNDGLLKEAEVNAHALLVDAVPERQVLVDHPLDKSPEPRDLTVWMYGQMFDGIEHAFSARVAAVSAAVDVLRDSNPDAIPREGVGLYSLQFLMLTWIIAVYHTRYPTCSAQISVRGASVSVDESETEGGYLALDPLDQGFLEKMRAAVAGDAR